jgi:hypothetical protein
MSRPRFDADLQSALFMFRASRRLMQATRPALSVQARLRAILHFSVMLAAVATQWAAH